MKRDRAAVHRGSDRADQAAAASLGGPEERLIEQAAQPVAAFRLIHAGKVNVGLTWPGLGDEPGQEPASLPSRSAAKLVSVKCSKNSRGSLPAIGRPPHHWSMTEITSG